MDIQFDDYFIQSSQLIFVAGNMEDNYNYNFNYPNSEDMSLYQACEYTEIYYKISLKQSV